MDLHSYLTTTETAAALAARLDVSPGLVSQWRSGATAVTPERCIEIEHATGGAVTRRELRPGDWHRIWPELDPFRDEDDSEGGHA